MRRVEWEERGCFSAATEAPSGSGSATRLIGYDLINVSVYHILQGQVVF